MESLKYIFIINTYYFIVLKAIGIVLFKNDFDYRTNRRTMIETGYEVKMNF